MRDLIYFFDIFISILSSPVAFVHKDAQNSQEIRLESVYISNGNAYE